MKHGYPYYWQDGIQQQEDVLSSLMGLSETSGTLTRVSQDVLSSLMGLSETSGTLTRVSQSLGITKEQAKLVKICSR